MADDSEQRSIYEDWELEIRERYEGALNEARRLREQALQIGRQLSEHLRDLEWMVDTELERSPISDTGSLRPALMDSDLLRDAGQRLRDASQKVLSHAGGWGQVIDEIIDVRNIEIAAARRGRLR